ncbi:hypothetical protein PHJA_001237400 [Phtheirospermum japonicum]|uniref:Transmembrane protein 14C n=1 Tax=Phtheirospermum japonicum TaxID=374723 RepID=A0A830C3U6_9LAMI|nr:hypothetical protein PHJA_001237400 [Phtheirospermum japonicum]
MPSAIAQLSCFSSIISNRRLQLQGRSYSFRPGKALKVMCSDGRGADVSNLESKNIPSYIESIPLTEDSVVGASNGHVQEQFTSQPKRAAKIHDFCFGIPFGGLVACGGLVGSIFTRNPVTLKTGMLYGGALLALSTISLKVWRQGKSSFPFILGQAVLSIALLWKNIQAYSLTRKLFPTAFNAVISAAMICFYSYVVLSGGNPPPKKLKSSASVASS